MLSQAADAPGGRGPGLSCLEVELGCGVEVGVSEN